MAKIAGLLIACTLTGCGPLGPVPGGALEGEAAPAPSDWSFSESEKHLQLETRPSDPYSVNVWGVGIGSAFYVGCGRGEDAHWARHIAADPRVRLRIAGRIFELQASRVSERTELDQFLEAMKRKYDWEPRAEQLEEALLFRFDPR